MRCTTLLITTILIFGVFLSSPDVFARKNPGKLMGKWWENSLIREKLGLNESQINQLRDIHYRYEKELINLRAEMQRRHLDLQEAMDAENWNDQEIIKLARASLEARNQVELKQLEMVLEMRKILTPEQWKKLHELKQHVRQRMRERMMRNKKHRKGPRNQPHPEAPPSPEPPPAPPAGV